MTEVCNYEVWCNLIKRKHGKVKFIFSKSTYICSEFFYSIWHCYKNIKMRLLLRCIHHFKSDLINNMDHMRIIRNNGMWRLNPGVSPAPMDKIKADKIRGDPSNRKSDAEQCKPVGRDIHQSHFSWVSCIFFHIKEVVYMYKAKSPPHMQYGSGSIFLKYKCCFNELHCMRSLACSIWPNLEPHWSSIYILKILNLIHIAYVVV